MSKKALTSREHKIFILAVLLVFIFVGYQFFYKSFKEKGELLDKKIKSLEIRLKKNQKILAEGRNVDASYNQLIKTVKQKRSEEKEKTLILSEIESVAKEMEMRVTDIKPKKVRKSDYYNKFSVGLTLDGELVSVMKFIYLLENKPHNFRIDEMRLERSFGRSSKLRCRLTLSRILVP